MIKLNLFHIDENQEEHVDIHYSYMQPVIRKVIDLVHNEQKIIIGKLEDEIYHLKLDDIYYIDCVEKKTFAYLKDKVYEIEGSLNELENRLSSYGFVRINKSNIINIYRIKALKPEMNMRVCATFDNGEKLYINRSYKSSFHDYLKGMKGVLNEK